MNTLALHAAIALAVPAALIVLQWRPIRARVPDTAEWAKNVFRAGSKLIAAICGRSGFYSLSAECGHNDGVAWRAARFIIDLVLGEGHCRNAAEREGLV